MTRISTIGVRHMLRAGTAAALFAGVPAIAQTETGQPSLSASGRTFSVPAREIELSVAADATYDSNVLGGRVSTENDRGLEKEDLILRPRVEGTVALPAGPVQLSLSGLVGYDIYTRNDELSSERINLRASAAGGLPGCGAAVSAAYSRAQNDLRDLSIVPGDIEASSVNVQTVSQIGATVYCGQSTGIRPMGLIDYRTSRNSNGRRRGSNVDNISYGGGLMYSNPVLGELSAFFSKSEFNYPDADPISLAPFPDVDATSFGARFDRRLGARLQFNGQVTYVRVRVDGIAGNAYSGLNWDIGVSLRVSDNLQVSAATSRQINASAGFRSNFVRSQVYMADIDYAFTQRLHLGVSATRQTRDYDTSNLVPSGLDVTEDKYTRISGQLRFQRFRRLGFTLSAGYEKSDSSVSEYSYDGFTASVGARLLL